MDDKLGAAIYCPHITSIWNVNNYNNKKRTIHGGDSNHNDCLRGRRRINLLYLVLAGPDKEFKICFRDDNFITTLPREWRDAHVAIHVCGVPSRSLFDSWRNARGDHPFLDVSGVSPTCSCRRKHSSNFYPISLLQKAELWVFYSLG